MIGKIEKQLKMDDYDLEAVFTPAMVNIILLVFIIACNVIITGYDLSKLVWWETILEVLGVIAVAVILTRFLMNLFRGMSKLFEDINYGKDRLHFPTTSMLLLNDKSISQDLKKRVREELKATYNICLLSKAKEEADEQEARRTAKDAAATIRQVVADSKDSMTRRKLKRYGAYRNFLGGALPCFPLSVAICIIINCMLGTCGILAIGMTIIYLILIVVDHFLTKTAATDYAETLITTFDKIK